jgi:subtilase family serine protease
VAVGGTNLKTAANTRGWTETAWSGAGSGCSSQISKPSWQTDTGCSRRTVADVSAVADPNTGVAVYDSYGSSGGANWYVFGGTSVASPIVASVYGLAGNASSTDYPARIAYAAPAGSLFDVTSGSNGNCTKRKPRGGSTTGSYLCTAGPGYDGPTGLGTPNGTTGF